MKLPDQLSGELDRIGAATAAREMSRQDAVTALRNAIDQQADGVLRLGILADFAARTLESWLRARRQPGAPARPELQSELFPDLPVRLYVRPAVAKPVILFTAHDWDCAKAMIENRTDGAIKTAEADMKAFSAAYSKVRPLLSGDLTTADVATQLDTPAGPAVPEARFTTP